MRRLCLDADKLRRLYYEDNLTPMQIANHFGCTEGAVRNEMKRQNFIFRGVKEAHAHLFGKDNPAWKGGKYKHGGYIYVRVGKRQYRREHILVWEKANGRKLNKGEVIHHLNGIKDDNRIENLYAISRRGHSRLETAEVYKKRIRLLEKELRVLKNGIRPLPLDLE